jgi:hypothetical protein
VSNAKGTNLKMDTIYASNPGNNPTSFLANKGSNNQADFNNTLENNINTQDKVTENGLAYAKSMMDSPKIPSQIPIPTIPSQNDKAIENRPIDVKSTIDLTGVWNCDDKGTYYLRQIGNTLWWYGEQKSNNPLWSNVAHGTITDNTINLEWGRRA